MLHAIVLAAACCSVTGHVRSADGRPIDHATVVLAARTERRVASGAHGTFGVDLPAGSLRLVVSAPGYTSKERDGVTIHGADTVEVTGAIGKTWSHFDLTLAGQNLTNAVSGRFTRIGAGIPYTTLAGPAPTDAFVLTPASVRAILSIR